MLTATKIYVIIVFTIYFLFNSRVSIICNCSISSSYTSSTKARFIFWKSFNCLPVLWYTSDNRLNQCYEDWIDTYDKGKLLIIDVDKLDFVQNEEDLGDIIQRIDTSIHGLF